MQVELEIDEALLGKLMALTGQTTEAEAVIAALRELVDDHARRGLVVASPNSEVPMVHVARVGPFTVVEARYGGAYEGGDWLSFPCRPKDIHVATAFGDDLSAQFHWLDMTSEDPNAESVETRFVGRGETALLAVADMLRRLRDGADEDAAKAARGTSRGGRRRHAGPT